MMTVRSKQHGLALLIVLIWLLVMTVLALSAAQIGLQEFKTGHSYREREIAWRSAEAGLIDAQVDIDASPDPVRSRSANFNRDSRTGFPSPAQPICLAFGLCREPLPSEPPAWIAAGLRDDDRQLAVSYGRFTGRVMQVGAGALPAQLPRYVIEILRDPPASDLAAPASYFYRITAIGFGIRPSTKIILQSFYRKGFTA
jgi:type IV pilus assembly protein PilX